jgi:hypothetical protein
MINVRKSSRRRTLIDGSFEVNAGKQGSIIFTNINETGCGVSLTDSVPVGSKIRFAMRMPGSPVNASGQVMWTRKRRIQALYCTDAGIRIDEIDPADKYRVMSSFYSKQ